MTTRDQNHVRIGLCRSRREAAALARILRAGGFGAKVAAASPAAGLSKLATAVLVPAAERGAARRFLEARRPRAAAPGPAVEAPDC